MLAMKQAGAATYAQDEKSCIVYGMPKKAVDFGGVKASISIPQIASMINDLR